MQPRQLAILRMLAEGKRVQEVADSLFVHRRTVLADVCLIKAYLRADTLAEAIARAKDNRIL